MPTLIRKADGTPGQAAAGPKLIRKAPVSSQERAAADARARYKGPGEETGRDPRNIPLMKGYTFGLQDELMGTVDAAKTGVKNIGRRLMGEEIPYTAAEAYDASVNEMAAQEAKLRQDRPGFSTANEILGAVGNPVSSLLGGWVGKGATVGAQAARGALVGGGVGAASGAANEREDRLGGAVRGGATGAALGAAVPLVVSGVDKATRPLRDAAGRRLADAVARSTGRPAPAASARLPKGERRAAEVLERAIGRDAAAGVTRRSGAAPYLGGGRNLGGTAEAIGQSPGPGRQVVLDAAEDVFAGGTKAVKQDVGQAMGARGDFLDTLDNAIQSRRQEANKGIEKLGTHLVTLDDDSVVALRSQLARDAISKRAAEALASPSAEIRSDGARLNRLFEDVLDKPGANTITVRDAQEISRSLLKAADTAYRAGDGGRGEAYKSLGKAIRENAATPERGGFADYGAWLKKYGDDSDNIEALNLGADVFSPKHKFGAIPKAVKGMSEAEREHFQKGVAEALLEKVRSAGGGINAMRQLIRSEDFAERIRPAFPSDAAFDQFMASAARRVQDQQRAAEIIANSRTAFRQAAQADLAGEGMADELGQRVAELDLKGAAKVPLKRAIRGLIPGSTDNVLKDPQANLAVARGLTQEEELTRLLNQLQADRALAARARLSNRSGLAIPALVPGAVSATQPR